MKFTARRLFNFSFICATVFTCVNYSIYQEKQISHYKGLLEIEEKRSSVNEDQLNELVLRELKYLGENDIELAKNQGISEGILQTINPTENQVNSKFGTIWHDGYNQGLEQNKWVASNSYTEGYHLGIQDALRDIGADHPAFKYASEVNPTEENDENKYDLETAKGAVKARALNRVNEESFEQQIEKYIEKQFKTKEIVEELKKEYGIEPNEKSESDESNK